MAESSKKRSGSFKKFLPSFFSKSKNKSKDTNLKVTNNVPKSNQYHDPRSVIRTDKTESDDNNRIYENLTTKRQNENDIQSHEISSNYSSSSTLVSVSVRNKKQHSFRGGDQQINYHSARPQVPRKPYCEMHTTNHHAKYPDVYYHSLEKLTDKISPMDEAEIYKASQVQANPASVGAEIKRVSTKFLISPKKESEVRTIQPTRARSLSFDRSQENEDRSQTNPKKSIKKAYNYSAPTSPIPINHKIPNMPKTASPYEHVRKHMIETEEKRNNSLSRGSLRKTTPSPGLEYTQPQRCTSVPSHSPIYKDTSLEKEKTLQKVEAFYWQKLKEMKEKEDEYLRQVSLRSSLRMNVHPQSNCSSPISHRIEPRSFSLPRGVELQTYSNQPLYATPFVRGTQERRTDTFVKARSPITEPEIIYRHPEKLFASPSSQPLQKTPIFHRGSLNRQTSIASQPKRVSFEEQYSKPERAVKSVVTRTSKVTNDIPKPVNQGNECSTNRKVSEMSRGPPRPPMRTTSVGAKTFKLVNNSRIIYSAGTGHSLYSESESGSEAGEIQRILQSHTQKEEDWHGDGSRMDGGLSDGEASRGPSRSRSSRRDDPRRHTLAGANHLYAHPHHAQHNAHDLDSISSTANVPEYATVTKPKEMRPNRILDARIKKPPLPRVYQNNNNALLFDDDPGIMSEVETSSTGFRRGGKQRSSLPVVRTPSKTLERPLGLVFLQYRNETKRALLPNEITSIDTVKALFVRSFPKQLTMQYMDSPLVKIYIHDSSKDMFYELEDDRAHLRDIRDRSVLRLFESTDIGGGAFPGAVGVGSLTMPPTMPATMPAPTCSGPSSWDQDQNYFSEPEIDSEYHHQHVHKSKVSGK